MMNRKAFQLSINMLVVLILGLVLLGVGVGIFSQAYTKAIDIKKDVDFESQKQLQKLLQDDIIAVPFATKDANRGESVVYNIGLKNELGKTKFFRVLVVYRGSSAYDPDKDPFHPVRNNADVQSIHDGDNFCSGQDCPAACGQDWVLMGPDDTRFKLENNAEKLFPINIVVPKTASDGAGKKLALAKGQYVFNMYICASDTAANCDFTGQNTDYIISNQYSSTKQLILNIN